MKTTTPAAPELEYPPGFVDPYRGCDIIDSALSEMRAKGSTQAEMDKVYAANAPRVLDSIAWMDEMHAQNSGSTMIKQRLCEIRAKHSLAGKR